MSTIRTPVGPQPPKVYWRRRLLVALGAVAVIVIVILIIVRPGSGATPAADKTSTPAPTTSTASDPSAACADGVIAVTAVTDKTTYASGQMPQISMKIANNGAKTCTVNAGSTQQDLVITSGSEKIWDSKDCQTGAVDFAQILKPGQSVTTTAIPWNRVRSSKTTCSATNAPLVTAGGASYHLGVSLGAVKSKETVQFILN